MAPVADSLTTPRRLRLRAAAEYLGCAPRSLSNPRWRTSLGIPTYRLGRALIFDARELDAWLEDRREKPDPEAA